MAGLHYCESLDEHHSTAIPLCYLRRRVLHFGFYLQEDFWQRTNMVILADCCWYKVKLWPVSITCEENYSTMKPNNILEVSRFFLGLRKNLVNSRLWSTLYLSKGACQKQWVFSELTSFYIITPKKFCHLIETKAGLALLQPVVRGKCLSLHLLSDWWNTGNKNNPFLHCSPAPASLNWTPVLNSGWWLLTKTLLNTQAAAMTKNGKEGHFYVTLCEK